MSQTAIDLSCNIEINIAFGNLVLRKKIVFIVCVVALLPSQQFFNYVGTISILPGMNQY